MPAAAQMSCIDAPWKPERTKQRWAAARISSRRSDCSWALARRMTGVPIPPYCTNAIIRMNVRSQKWRKLGRGAGTRGGRPFHRSAFLVPLSQNVAGRVPSESDIGRDSHQLMRAEMGLPRAECGESRFAKYVEGIASVIGHADRVRPLWDYCVGLMMPCERKSVEPIAALTAPKRVGAQHQSLLHFVNQAPWSDEKVSAKVCEMVLPEIERHGPIEAWIIDDTGFPKKGRHSVGVSHQYCGQLGKQANCQT